MPINLLKKYNQLLELNSLSEHQRISSLKGIFSRDFVKNTNFRFRNKKLNPTPAEGEDTMERFFRHLTTVITDKATRKREYDHSRSERLHWVRFHIEERKIDNVLVFTVEEPEGKRTYIWDKDEDYIIVLEPLRKKEEYFLLTAYYMEGKDKARNKMVKKWKRRIKEEV